MSKHRKSPLEEEFEKHFSSEKGAWTNAWSPIWEDTMPLGALRLGAPDEDFPAKGDPPKASDQEEKSS